MLKGLEYEANGNIDLSGRQRDARIRQLGLKHPDVEHGPAMKSDVLVNNARTQGAAAKFKRDRAMIEAAERVREEIQPSERKTVLYSC